MTPLGFRWPWRRRVEIARAVDDEIDFHLEARVAELVHAGHPPADARRTALAEFGDLAGTRTYCVATDWEGERAMRRTERLTELRQDLAGTIRTIKKQPGFAATVVGTLGLGVGATTAIFVLIRSVLLAPLPFRAPAELMVIEQFMPGNPATSIGAMSPPNYLDVKATIPALASAGAYYDNEATLTGAGAPARLIAPAVTPSLFTTLGVAAALGRTFAEGEGAPGRPNVVLLSHHLWTERFGADAGILGRAIRLDSEPYTVIGVMPPGFVFPVSGADLWLPLGWDASVASQRGAQYLGAVGRLKSAETPAQLSAQLASLSSRLIVSYPDSKDYLGLRAQSFTDAVVGETKRPLLLVGGAAVLLILIGCANATSLLLARVNGRATELSVRAALGAGRRRLVRQILTESVALGGLGGLAGAAIAAIGLTVFLRQWPGLLPRQETLRLGAAVPMLALALSIVAGFLIGIGPSRQAARTGAFDRLRSGKQSQSGGDLRLRRTLVAAELGLATVLLTGAMLLIHAIGQLRRVDPGFRPDQVISFRTQLPSAAYRTSEAIDQFYGDFLDRIGKLPGVDGAAATMRLPLSGGGFGGTFTSAVPTEAGNEEDRRAQVRAVTEDYFRVMGIPLRQGRGFSRTDRRGAPPVLIASEGFSKRFWPATGAVGKSVRFGVRFSDDRPEGEIVGVVGDVRAAGLHRDPSHTVYAVSSQVTSNQMSFVIRSRLPVGDLIPSIRVIVEARDRDIVLDQVATLNDVIASSLGQPRFVMQLLALFAAVAVLLAIVGIYGVVSYAVAQRAREIGVRIALGADQGRVIRTVVGQEIRWAVGGLAIGAVAATATAPLLASAVFGINPTAPLFQLLAPTGLLVVAAVACFIPARRAALVSPLRAIQAE